MAIYFCRLSHGKVGSGLAHYQYINGIEQYDYKKNEIAYQKENMPEGVTGKEFFKTADEMERVNGMVYKEIKVSLPNEFSQEDNQNLLDDFLEKQLGDKYYYSAVIHNKEVERGKQQNVHAHITFCTRENDNIKRDLKLFFKQAQTKNLARGGCPKNPKWDSTNKKTLEEVRLNWETTINEHLVQHNIEPVSRLSLKAQYEKALAEQDFAKANLLKRKAINIQMNILKKIEEGKKLTNKENKLYKKFLKNKAVKYSLEKEYKEILALKEKVKTNKIEIKSINENIKNIKIEKPHIDNKFKGFIDLEESILNIEKELAKVKIASSFSAVIVSAVSDMEKNYKTLSQEYDNTLDKLNKMNLSNEINETKTKELTKKIAILQDNMSDIYNKIQYEQPEKLVEIVKLKRKTLEEKQEKLEVEKEKLINERERLYADINVFKRSGIDKIVIENKLSSVVDKLTDLKWNLKNINKELILLEKKLDPETLKETSKNILTKGVYRKNKEETQKTIEKINLIVREIKGGIYKDNPTLKEQKLKEYESLKNKLDNLKKEKPVFNKIDTYKLNKIEREMKEKFENKKENLFSKRQITEQEIAFYKMFLTENNHSEKIFEKKQQEYSNKKENSYNESLKYQKIKETLNNVFSKDNITKLAYNIVTKGKYNKIIKEYDTLSKKIKELEKNKKELGSLSLAGHKLGSEIKKLNKEKENIKTRYENMMSGIDPAQLKKIIYELENHKTKTINGIGAKGKEEKQKEYEYSSKAETINKIKKEVYPYTFENFKSKANNLHRLQKEDTGYSKCLFDEELENRKKYELEKNNNEHDDLGY